MALKAGVMTDTVGRDSASVPLFDDIARGGVKKGQFLKRAYTLWPNKLSPKISHTTRGT